MHSTFSPLHSIRQDNKYSRTTRRSLHVQLISAITGIMSITKGGKLTIYIDCGES
jgi:hypothetical protein